MRVLAVLVLVGCGSPVAVDAGVDAGSTVDAPVLADAPLDAAFPTGFRVEPSLPHPLQEITATTDKNRIVIAGGIDEGVALVTEVWAFDGTSWTALPSLPAPRHHAMLVARDGTLYLLGGMETLRFSPLDTVFALPPGASAWESRPPLPHPLAAAVGVVVGSEVVLCAGQTDRGLATSSLVGDPETGTYRDGAPIPLPREHVAGFARDGEVWVTGGRDFMPSASVRAVHVYDVASDAWREAAALATVRGGHSATLVGSTVLIAGGEIEGEALASFERIEAGSAIEGVLPSPRHGHGAAVLGGRVYLIGGADHPLFGATASVESWAP